MNDGALKEGEASPTATEAPTEAWVVFVGETPTWRIIPFSKWLITMVSKLFISYLGDLLTMVIHHLLAGMILQARTDQWLRGIAVTLTLMIWFYYLMTY